MLCSSSSGYVYITLISCIELSPCIIQVLVQSDTPFSRYLIVWKHELLNKLLDAHCSLFFKCILGFFIFSFWLVQIFLFIQYVTLPSFKKHTTHKHACTQWQSKLNAKFPYYLSKQNMHK
ncbi:hypothetical protein CsSME_00004600 [Camellia sinensis var. sinensis]